MKTKYLIILLSVCITACSGNKTKENSKKLPSRMEYLYSIEKALLVADKVDTLRLSGLSLETISDDIVKLKNLRCLYLGDNPKVDYAKALINICKLENLEELDLTGDQIKSLPKEIGNLKNLKALWIGANPELDLKDVFDKLKGLKNLKELTISFNEKEEIPENISLLQNLEILYLDGNSLKTLPSSLKELKKLNTLSLISNPGLDLKNVLTNLKDC